MNLKPRSAHVLTRVGAVLFLLSLLFPVVASMLSMERAPLWLGTIDVVLALALVALSAILTGAAQGAVDDRVKLASYQGYRLLLQLPIVLLLIFFVAGEWIRWEVLLPGLAWRVWVLAYILPSASALWFRR